MIVQTMIARQHDGLLLAAFVQDQFQASSDLMQYQVQAKEVLKMLARDPRPPARCSLESDMYVFHLVVEQGVCYLALCWKMFSRRKAYAYLEDLQYQFQRQFGARVGGASRPYCFIEFDMYIQKQGKSYMDSRQRRNASVMRSEPTDPQNVTVLNVFQVLHRLKPLSELVNKALEPSRKSEKYKRREKYKKKAACDVRGILRMCAIIAMVIVLVAFVISIILVFTLR
ncbi:vesicle-trafficking protein SEC22b-A-like [Babylonia areolata]|uniref:vesicle-trafficking protein SEC22b-A-like n=1 Tax=Babylonia areolata TaxID=304850 RepID=UPI003FD24D3C